MVSEKELKKKDDDRTSRAVLARISRARGMATARQGGQGVCGLVTAS